MALKGLEQKKPASGVDYGTHLASKPVTAMVTSDKVVSGQTVAQSASESQVLHPGMFATNGMSITVEGGRVLNLGNYETARIGVTITVPCSPETLEHAYQFATDWVSGKIEETVKDAKGEA